MFKQNNVGVVSRFSQIVGRTFAKKLELECLMGLTMIHYTSGKLCRSAQEILLMN